MTKKYAVLGDIHANLDALQTVLADAQEQGVTDYICVGDVVGYNAYPNECCEIIRELGAVTVRGNHDHYCAFEEPLDDFHPMAAAVVEWSRRELTEDNKAWLRSLEYIRKERGITIVHATLDMPERWGYVFESIEAEPSFPYQKTQLCFHGHTHVPVVFEQQQGNVTAIQAPGEIKLALGRKYFLNTGSVGQPRDQIPDASYCIYDADAKTVTYRRLPYDIEKACAAIRAAGLPDRLAERLTVGR